MGRLRQFNRMQAVFHAMHSGIEQSVSGLSGRAAIGITICWMSGIGRGSRIDSRSRATQISLKQHSTWLNEGLLLPDRRHQSQASAAHRPPGQLAGQGGYKTRTNPLDRPHVTLLP